MKKLTDLILEKSVPVLDKKTVIPLSDLSPKLAKAAVDNGLNDNSKPDDVASYSQVSIPVKKLKAAQTEIIPEKAIGMAIGMMLGKTLKIGGDLGSIMSNDNYIMDGHHRWAATYLCDPNASVTGTKIGLDGIPLVSVLNIITKGVHNRSGNAGKGNIKDFTGKKIGEVVAGYAKDGIGGDFPISADDVKERLGRVPGAKGDWEKGMELMMHNADLLPKTIMKGAPARIDMPVIQPEEVKAAAEMIKTGKIDLTNPFSEETTKAIKECFVSQESLLTENQTLSSNDQFMIIDAANMYAEVPMGVEDRQWDDANALVNYLLSDCIPKKYHEKFKKVVARYITENYVETDENFEETNESVRHQLHHCILITKDFKIEHSTVENDLAADAFSDANFGNKNCAFAFYTTDSRWQGLADDAIKALKAGKKPADYDYDVYELIDESDMSSFIDKKFHIEPRDLEVGKNYVWFMGAEPLTCTYLGKSSIYYVFKLEKSEHKLNIRAVESYIFDLAYLNESVNESAEEKTHAVKLIGGSIGENRPNNAKGYKGQKIDSDEKLYTESDAKTEAKARTKRNLSEGERKHYGLKYVAIKVVDGIYESIESEDDDLNESLATEIAAYTATMSKSDIEYLTGMIIGMLGAGGGVTYALLRDKLQKSKIRKEKLKELDVLIKESFTIINENLSADIAEFIANTPKGDLEYMAGALIGLFAAGGGVTYAILRDKLQKAKFKKLKELNKVVTGKDVNENLSTDIATFIANTPKGDLEYMAGALIGLFASGGTVTYAILRDKLQKSKLKKEKLKEIDSIVGESVNESDEKIDELASKIGLDEKVLAHCKNGHFAGKRAIEACIEYLKQEFGTGKEKEITELTNLLVDGGYILDDE